LQFQLALLHDGGDVPAAADALIDSLLDDALRLEDSFAFAGYFAF